MSRRKITKIIILLFIIIISNLIIFEYANLRSSNIILSFNVISDKTGIIKLYYSEGEDWKEENSQEVHYNEIGEKQHISFDIPKDSNVFKLLLNNQSNNMIITDLRLSYIGKIIELNNNYVIDKFSVNNIVINESNTSYISINTEVTDSFITYEFDDNFIEILSNHSTNVNVLYKLAICLITNVSLVILVKKPTSIFILIKDLYNSRGLIWNLAKNDFKTKYAGSYLGIVWAFIQPIITILVYWFVFEFGLKSSSPIEGIPFILWFATGLIPWFFFSDALMYATNCLVEYSYLVKKVVFKISVLPIVKTISALFVHLVFIAFIIILYCLYGYYPSLYIIQLPYYVFCTLLIVLALSYVTSSIVLFFKDLGQIINIFLQIGMWMTPIMWSYTIIPEKYQWIFKLNPMFYIVEGYRDTFINHIWFFDKIFQTTYFWIIAIIIFGLGAIIFKKLKPHFADVL